MRPYASLSSLSVLCSALNARIPFDMVPRWQNVLSLVINDCFVFVFLIISWFQDKLGPLESGNTALTPLCQGELLFEKCNPLFSEKSFPLRRVCLLHTTLYFYHAFNASASFFLLFFMWRMPWTFCTFPSTVQTQCGCIMREKGQFIQIIIWYLNSCWLLINFINKGCMYALMGRRYSAGSY